jgi:transketolase
MTHAHDHKLMADTIRALAMDAVQQANSGHPGAPMGMAEIAVALWGHHLKHNPADPAWADRDRFVLSNGHASMLLYALLHLTGYDLAMSELRNFRQLHSKTPGHPEVDVTPGVETTTGPLGQGLANAVGMALAEKLLAAEFNRPGHAVVDHRTWVFVGDGCLMEGISHEACALASAWKLNKLVAVYDDNGISIDGPVKPWYVDDVRKRFEGYGWNVIGPIDGHDVDAVLAALAAARSEALRPSIVICRTTIGQGSPNRAGSAKAHGEALGEAEVKLTREALGWTQEPFVVPEAAYEAWDARDAGARAQTAWVEALAAYRSAHPELAAEFERRLRGELPATFVQATVEAIQAAHDKAEAVATRKASQLALEVFTRLMPELLGGSADLTGSNLTNTSATPPLRFGADGAPLLTDGRPGRHVNYGVREFGMAAVMNGVALHGGHIPYGGTFLTFSDYSRNAIRMAALMKRRVIHVFTHDSIGLGEDGPTHQSVEHAASLRLIPNLDVWRPADSVETLVAWTMALGNVGRPSALLLTRQTVPYLPKPALHDIGKGGYVLADPAEVGLGRKKPRAVIVATGSEVQLALHAQAALARDGIATRVVSIPSTSVFDRQSLEYKAKVLPAGIPRIAVEAGVTDGWWKYGCAAVIGIDRYGESAPAGALFKLFHLTADNVAAVVRQVLAR